MSGGLQVAGDFGQGRVCVCSDGEQLAPHSLFGTPEPSGRVGTSVVETTVDHLERALFRDHSHAVLVAPPGPRKTDVLRALARRLAGALHVVLLTDCDVSENEICAQILFRWGQTPVDEPEQQLVHLVDELANSGSALVLLVNDANWMPEGTLRCLGRLASNSRRGLRLGLVVAIEGRQEFDPVACLVSTLGFGVEKIILDEVGTKTEVRVLAQLPRALPPASLAETVANLWTPRADAAGGVQTFPNGARPARWAKRAAVALGIALALFGVHQIAIPAASREVALELEPETVEQSDPIASASPADPEVAVPVPEREVALELEPETVEEGDPTGSSPPVESDVLQRAAVGSGRGQSSQPAAARQRVFESPRRMIAVSLNARPWGRIEVDGRDVGVTPLGDLPMSPGLHRFRVHLADGRVLERVVSVDSYHDHLSFP